MNYLTLPIGEQAPEVINAVIEVAGGQVNKYEFDKHLNVFRLDRPLYASVHYPGDYGFIPSTFAPDEDPLDIMVLLAEPTFTGCLVEARAVGVLEMLDQEIPDQKVLAVAVSSPKHARILNCDDFQPHILREIEHFFAIYKELEGKRTQVLGWGDSSRARQLIEESHNAFLARLPSEQLHPLGRRP